MQSLLIALIMLLFLLASSPAAPFPYANDITRATPRRLRQENKIHSRGGNLLCANENTECNNQRFQPKYRISGRSYFFKKTSYEHVVPKEEHSRPPPMNSMKRKKNVLSRAKAKIRKDNDSRKFAHNWNHMFANARRNVAKKSRRS